jgi:DNA modification methylase
MQLIHGDTIEEMAKLPDNSVDLILADLPYGTTSNAWDVVVPFDELWQQYERLIKENGAILLFGSQPFTTLLISSNFKLFREQLIWVKNKAGSGLRAKQRHLKTHEEIIVFSLTGKYTYNPIKWHVSDKKFLTQRRTMSVYGDSNNNYGNLSRSRKPDDGSRYPISLLPFSVPITPAKNKHYAPDVDLNYHPTQKPIALLEYLIKTYSNTGDVVLDNTMGSGSTGVASVDTGRDFIGIELDDKYFEIAKERVEDAVAKAKAKEN